MSEKNREEKNFKSNIFSKHIFRIFGGKLGYYHYYGPFDKGNHGIYPQYRILRMI